MEFEHIYYDITEPNQSIILAKDTAVIEYKGKKHEGPAEVRLDFQPRTGIHIRIQFANEFITIVKFHCDGEKDDFAPLLLKERNIKIPGELNIRTWSPSQPIIGLGNETTEMKKIVFHLFNFKDLSGTGRKPGIKYLDLEDEEWQIEIKSLDSTQTTFNTIKETGGFGLTHIGCIKHKDDSSFEGKDAQDILTALNYFLSFMMGYRCSPSLAVGLNETGEKVWEYWLPPGDADKKPRSWISPSHCEHLSALFAGFMIKWNDESWQDAIKEIFYWYFISNNLRELEPCIILVQAAIERLSYEYTVKNKRLIESDGFKQLRASDKFRLLLSSLDIPIDIPGCCTDISQTAKSYNWVDSPHAITEIRNSIIHPEHKKRDQLQHLYWETKNLGLWYLELALLRIFDYNGKYQNRLTAQWSCDEEDVPWR